jgi:hypothetical protein
MGENIEKLNLPSALYRIRQHMQSDEGTGDCLFAYSFFFFLSRSWFLVIFFFFFLFSFDGVHLSGCHLFPFSCHLALSSPVLEFSHLK